MNAIVDNKHFVNPASVKSGFQIDQADRLTINGKHFDFAGQSGDTVFLHPSDEQGMTEQFTMGNLSRLSATGMVKHEVGYYLPDDLKPSPLAKAVSFKASDLDKKQQKRFLIGLFRSKRSRIWFLRDLFFRANRISRPLFNKPKPVRPPI